MTVDNLETSVSLLKNYCRTWGRNKNRLPDLIDIDEWSPGGDGRLDMLTLDLKTWLIRGFEIKMSRSDFLADRKWESYLPYVNYFWFVVPREGIINPAELPADIGLLIYGTLRDLRNSSGPQTGLREFKKAKKLQPRLVRLSYGELQMTQILIRLCRSHQWRNQVQYSQFRTRILDQIDNFLHPIKFPGKQLVGGRIRHIMDTELESKGQYENPDD